MLIDSHAHLQWATFDTDRATVIKRAHKEGVEGIVNIGFDVQGSIAAIRLAEQHDGLYATIGIHPHNARQLDQQVLKKLKTLAEHPKVVAIGEIGLDYYRNLSPRDTQRQAFRAQLTLAENLELPVVIHDRDAHTDVAEILATFQGKAVLHCFSGSRELADQYLQRGFFISFAGPVTYPNARRLHEAATWTDLGKILLETDSPWLAPQAVRGQRNEPAFLRFIARKIADLKGTSVEEIADVTVQNTRDLFRLS
jgi:TatD DNase family protein